MKRNLFITIFLMFSLTISAASDIRVLHPKVKRVNAGESIEVKAGVINAYKVNYIILHFKDVDEKNWSEKEMIYSYK